MARNYVAVPYEYLEEMEPLTDEEFGRLMRDLIAYSQTGTPITSEGNERFYAKRVTAQEDRFRSSYEEQAEAYSERGKAGAKARWSNAKNAKACFSITSNAKNGKTETKSNTNSKSTTPYSPPSGGDHEGAFEKFWAAYPKKVGKQAAKKAFNRIKDVPVQTMIDAVEYQRSTAQWTQNNGQYIPHPATWLNQGRWEDEVSQERALNATTNPFLEIAREEEAKKYGQT